MMLEAHCTFRNNLLKLPTKYGNILDKPMIVPLKRSTRWFNKNFTRVREIDIYIRINFSQTVS